MLKILFTVAAAASLVISCNNETAVDETDGFSAFNADSLGANIGILASDDFAGRKPFSEGENKTINFLKEAFTRVGLEPGNGNSYFQDVPMVSITTNAAPVMKVSTQPEVLT